MVIGLIGAGVIIAVLGWLDDRKDLSAGLRFAVHIIAAIWAVSWIGGLPEISIGYRTLRLGFAGSILAVVGIVWSINLYNFMDGIDGFSGAEAVTVATFGGLLSLLANNLLLAHLSFALAISVGGFLAWNWPPAKIFMGDVGSCFLGLTFAYLALLSEKTGGAPLIVWLMLLSVFIADATLTVIRRQMSGEKWYEAHRSHVYQLAVQAGYSHKEVTVMVIFMNACLALMALIAQRFQSLLFPLFIISYGLLTILHVWLYTKWATRSVGMPKTNDK
jgi:Fuc2NAc and GlcNAc transferase